MMTNVWLITALTNLHAGNENTSNYGIIDNAIQRDALTDLPCINSSSLKGAINEFCCHAEMDEKLRLKIFGSDKKGKNESQKGASLFFDAKILLLPVQDDNHLYSYVTCKDVINAANERISMFDKKMMNLPDAEQDLKQAIKADRDIKIIDSPEFAEICDDEHLPIIARNALENGISKNLWYEQVLPAKTILYTITVDPDGSLADAIDGRIIQIGADATIGYGYCRFTRLNK